MNRAALYIRVSTLEQAQEGYSVGEQKERLIRTARPKTGLSRTSMWMAGTPAAT